MHLTQRRRSAAGDRRYFFGVAPVVSVCTKLPPKGKTGVLCRGALALGHGLRWTPKHPSTPHNTTHTKKKSAFLVIGPNKQISGTARRSQSRVLVHANRHRGREVRTKNQNQRRGCVPLCHAPRAFQWRFLIKIPRLYFPDGNTNTAAPCTPRGACFLDRHL